MLNHSIFVYVKYCDSITVIKIINTHDTFTSDKITFLEKIY